MTGMPMELLETRLGKRQHNQRKEKTMRNTKVLTSTVLVTVGLVGTTLGQELELYENTTALGSRPCIANVGDGPIEIVSARLNKREDVGCNFAPGLNEFKKPALQPKFNGMVAQSPIRLEVGDQTCFMIFTCARHLVHVSVETDQGPVEWGK